MMQSALLLLTTLSAGALGATFSASSSTGSTAADLTANARLWNISSDPMPPYLPKECSAQRMESNNYTFLDTGANLRLTFLPGYEFFSYQHLTTHSMAGGYENNYAPISMMSWTNFTDPLDPKAGMQMKVFEGQCDFWPIEGGTDYTGYDYYANLIMDLYNMGSPVYYSTSADPEYGAITSYTASLLNAGGIVNYTASFHDTDKLLYYIANGYQWCCLDFCPGEGGVCREGGSARYSRTYSEVKYTNYVVYEDNYVWPPSFLYAPECPYSTQYCGGELCPSDPVEPAAADEYTQEEYDQLAVSIAIPLGICLLISWVYIIYLHRTVPQAGRTTQQQGDVEAKVMSPMYR